MPAQFSFAGTLAAAKENSTFLHRPSFVQSIALGNAGNKTKRAQFSFAGTPVAVCEGQL